MASGTVLKGCNGADEQAQMQHKNVRLDADGMARIDHRVG